MKKRICFFIGDISSTGGTEAATISIANFFINEGHEVTILSYRNGEKPSFTYNEKIVIKTLNLEKYKGFLSRKITPYLKLLSFFKKNHYDFVINVDMLLCMYTLPIKMYISGMVYGWEHFNFRANRGVKNRDRARWLASKLADGIIVLTDMDKIKYENELKLNCKIYTINNPISQPESNPLCASRDNTVVAVGRLTHQKNLSDLIDVWDILGEDTVGWNLSIVGSGEEEQQLKEKVHQKNLINVHFTGFVRNTEQVYQKSKILVMTSLYEGLPMVLLEGQANGLSIVSYDCYTGPSEVIDNGNNGFLIPMGNKDEFAEKLKYLLKNEDELKQMSEKAVLSSRRFFIEEIGEKWCELLIDQQ